MKKLSILSLKLSALIFTASIARSEVYFDHEADPVPLFDLTVILPVGSASSNPRDAANLSLIPSLMDAGTLKLNREAFLDLLANYGASLSFSMGYYYSTWSLSFPYQEQVNYEPLLKLLEENWNTPRFTATEFNRYKTMSVNGIKSSLNSDSQLVTSTARRWLISKTLGLAPVYLDSYSKSSLAEIKKLYESKIRKPSKMWAGFVGPPELKDMAQKLITRVFKQTQFENGKYLKQLPTESALAKAQGGSKRQLLAISKPGRTQNVIALFNLAPEKLATQNEFLFLLGDHVTANGGLGSVYGEALRTKGGFSYTVASTSNNNFLGFPVLGFFSNPMVSKQEAAMQSIDDLLKDTYENGELFTRLARDDWDTRIKSLRYEKVFAQMTPDSRLSERSSIVVGGTSPEFYASNPLDWNATRQEVQKFFQAHWQNSSSVLAILGDPIEIEKIAAKHFSDFEVKVIPYTDSVLSKTFE